MQTLTLEQVKTAARDYYERGMLTAQHPISDNRACVYELNTHSGYRCAIGAALNREALDKACGSVSYLVDCDIIRCTKADLIGLAEIQTAHDAWCGSIDRATAEELFKTTIGVAA
jgi:hypothetical protein